MKLFWGKFSVFVALFLLTVTFLPNSSVSNNFNDDSGNKVEFESRIVKAADQSNIDILKSLLDQGGDPNERGKFEATALHRAAFNGHKPTATLLITSGADLNAQDFGGATPMHIAVREGNTEMVKLLIQSGADINTQDNEGYTALHRAIVSQNVASAMILIEAGAEVNTYSTTGDSPIIDATRKNFAEVVEELIAKGANKSAKNNKGLDAFQYAENNNNQKLLQSLNKSKDEILRQKAANKSNIIVIDQKSIAENTVPAFLAKDAENKFTEPVKEIDNIANITVKKEIQPLQSNNEIQSVSAPVSDVSVGTISDTSDFGEQDLLVAASRPNNNTPTTNENNYYLSAATPATNDSSFEEPQEELSQIPLNEEIPVPENFDEILPPPSATANFEQEKQISLPEKAIITEPVKKTYVVDDKIITKNSYKKIPYPAIEPPVSIAKQSLPAPKPTIKITPLYNYNIRNTASLPEKITPINQPNNYKQYGGNDIVFVSEGMPASIAFKNAKPNKNTYAKNTYSNRQKFTNSSTKFSENLPLSLQFKNTNKVNLKPAYSATYQQPIAKQTYTKTNFVETSPQENAIENISPDYTKQEIIQEESVEDKIALFEDEAVSKAKIEVKPLFTNNENITPITISKKLYTEIPQNQDTQKVKEVEYVFKDKNNLNNQPQISKNKSDLSSNILSNMNEFYTDKTYQYGNKYDMSSLEKQRVKNLGINGETVTTIPDYYADSSKDIGLEATKIENLDVANKKPSLDLFDSLEQTNNENYTSATKPYEVATAQPDLQIGTPASLSYKARNNGYSVNVKPLDITKNIDVLALEVNSNYNSKVPNVAKESRYVPRPVSYALSSSAPEYRYNSNTPKSIQAKQIINNPVLYDDMYKNIVISKNVKKSVKTNKTNIVKHDTLHEELASKDFTLPSIASSGTSSDTINAAPLPDVQISEMENLDMPSIATEPEKEKNKISKTEEKTPEAINANQVAENTDNKKVSELEKLEIPKLPTPDENKSLVSEDQKPTEIQQNKVADSEKIEVPELPEVSGNSNLPTELNAPALEEIKKEEAQAEPIAKLDEKPSEQPLQKTDEVKTDNAETAIKTEPNIAEPQLPELPMPEIPSVSEQILLTANKNDVKNAETNQNFYAIIGAFQNDGDAIKYYNDIASRLGVVNSYHVIRDSNNTYKISIEGLKSKDEADKLCLIFKSKLADCSVSDTKISGTEVSDKKVYAILGEFDSPEKAKEYGEGKKTSVTFDYQIAKAGEANIYLLQYGPILNGEDAKKLCDTVQSANQKCKIAVQ